MIAPTTSKLRDLIALAEEPSSARRRELLREVTDLFFVTEAAQAPRELALFDDVMSHLAGEMEAAVRIELSARVAQSTKPPERLVRRLVRDDIAVAGPLLERGRLSDAVLLEAAASQGQAHLRAISRRETVSAAVSEAIVRRGDDDTLGELLRNEGAALSRAAHEAAVDRASANPALHEAVVRRRALPVDLLNEMYFVVEARLREQIIARNTTMDPADLERALEAGRNRVAQRDGALPDDYAQAEQAVRILRARGAITPQTLVALLRNRERTKFMLALAEMAEIDFHTARRILERRELDALAIVCKAAGVDRALFLTFTLLILDKDADAMGRAREYGANYEALSLETATRTLRFWRMRRQTGDVAAA